MEALFIIFSVIGVINEVTFSIGLGYALEPFGDNSGEAAGVLHDSAINIY